MLEIGFMQGRLVDQVNDQIQAFPKDNWEKEIQIAYKNNFSLMEWTLDQKNLYENPLMNAKGKGKIIQFLNEKKISIPSITGDCFMQKPFWKSKGKQRKNLEKNFIDICENCSSLGIKLIVVPVVDNGSIDNENQEKYLLDFMTNLSGFLKINNLKIIFESDLNPNKLINFIKKYPEDVFGINYDIGNSASLGFEAKNEFEAYGHRILNVHVKDRLFKGTTVPLGEGNADFERVFYELKRINYKGNLILQTARARKGKHVEKLLSYKKMIHNLVKKYS